MRIKELRNILFLAVILFGIPLIVSAQTDNLLKRTTYKTESFDFGAGGTLSVIGAPNGSIRVEGWNKNEVEITAEIEVQAESEEDLAQLAAITGYMLDLAFGHARIYSVGPHDKKYLKRVAKKFPKRLRSNPFRVDYVIKVPNYCDLNIDGVRGNLDLSNVEGTLRVNFAETNARLNLIGGTVIAAFGSGDVDVQIPAPSWRGRNLDIQLIQGNLNVAVARNLNAEIDAQIIRTGQIENSLNALKKRDRTEFTEKLILAKAGGGGASMKFMVGDGVLRLGEIGSL